MARIVTVTLNPAIDKCCSVDQLVAERKLRCSPAQYHAGGGGINVARAISNFGGKADAYWPCGGYVGDMLRQLLDEEKLNHRPVRIEAITRENLIVFEQSSEQQYRFNMPGATITSDEVQNFFQMLREIDPPPEYLVLSGSLPPGVDADLYAQIAKMMPSPCRVILDSRDEPLRLAMEASVYLIKPNMHELEQLAGRAIENDSEIAEITRSLVQARKAEVVVTSLGSAGAIMTTADQHVHIHSPTVKIRNKVGAGDSMVAGIVFSLSEGKTLEEAVRFGVAAGGAAVMNDGEELCNREDTWQLYNQMRADKNSHSRGEM